jgi:hypothetical protein
MADALEPRLLSCWCLRLAALTLDFYSTVVVVVMVVVVVVEEEEDDENVSYINYTPPPGHPRKERGVLGMFKRARLFLGVHHITSLRLPYDIATSTTVKN